MLNTLPRFSSLALLLFASASCSPAQTAAIPRPNITRDIPYTRDLTGTYRADLYEPALPGTHLAVVAIHGGSWRSGHKTEMRRLCTDLAAQGFTCFSIDYDTHAHSFPLSWQESRAAVAFLRDHAADYHIDPRHIAVLGTSAGGQLAALVALAPEGPTTTLPQTAQLASTPVTIDPGASPAPVPPRPLTPIPVEAAVLFNGGYDLHPVHYLLRRYLGGNCAQIPSVCNDASPDFHIHPDAPPIFVGHGTHDHLIPYSQATTFVSLLQAAHDPVTPFVATDAGHSYWRNRHWYAVNLAATDAFLKQSLSTPHAGQ